MRRALSCGVFVAVLFVSWFVSPARAADGVGLTSESALADYLQVAVARHPAIQSAQERYRAALERVPQARGWPDPIFRYGYFVREVETALGEQKQRFGLAQQLPLGKVTLRGDVAEQAALASGERYRSAYHSVLEEAAHAYYEYAHLGRAIEVTGGNLELLRDAEAVARARYSTGEAAHSDVIKAQTELAVLEDQLRSLDDRRVPLAAELRMALGLGPGDTIPWPVPLREPKEELPDEAAVLARIRSDNPSLRALDFEIKKEERAVSLARRERLPDVTVGVETILTSSSGSSKSDAGRDAWIASLSVPLPLFTGKYNAAIREADARRRSERIGRRDREEKLVALAERMLFEHRDALRQIGLYETSLIPLGEAALESALTGFRAGSIAFLDVLDAERLLLRFQLDRARARADRGERVASLLALMGTVPAGIPAPKEVQP
jgi:outer membrane protein TolC